MKRFIISLASVVPGSFLYALFVTLFLIPAGLVTGGGTGIALAVNHRFGIPISLFTLIFNAVMLLIGMLAFGKGFAATTLASSILVPAFLELCARLVGDFVLTDDLFLCTVFAGIGMGVALGIVIRSGASTGGMDIPPLVLNKYFRIPVSVGMYAFDFAILLLQSPLRPPENLLYGIVLVIIYTVVLDKTLLFGTTRVELKIISAAHEEISRAIMEQVDRGVTLLSSEGGYLHEDGRVILSVISNRELVKVERLVRDIDPECFMVVSKVSEVRGRGFSLGKQYRDKSNPGTV